MRSALIILAVLGTACAHSYISEEPTGSASIAADAESLRVFTANTLEGSVTMLDLQTDATRIIDVGEQPTRVARAGDRILVTVRGDRSLVEINATTGDIIRRVETGPEPYGVVVSQDGTRVYVSVSMAENDDNYGLIEERDGQTLEVLRTFSVPDQPRWLALHPKGDVLVVGRAFGDELTVLNLKTGESSPLALPVHTTQINQSGMPTLFPLSARVTGDPVFTADGVRLAVPAFYVDNISGEQGTDGVPTFPYYANTGANGMGRFNATVVVYRTRTDGSVDPVAQSTNLVFDFAATTADTFAGAVLRSYITSIVPSPDGLAWLVSMEASDAVLLVDATSSGTRPSVEGVTFPSISVAMTSAGPRGLVVLDDGSVLSHNFIDQEVSDIRYTALAEAARSEITGQIGASPAQLALPGISIEQPVLTDDELAGMRLFYSATSAEIGGTGVSCSTCHFEGRNDGLTWRLMNGDRNTPSLAGPIAKTGVVTWNNQVESVAKEAQFTAQFRMGSPGLALHQAEAVQAFLDITPLPDLPDMDADAIERGREIFHRPEVGCSDCHNGAHYTDASSHDMFGLTGVTTRPLFGIASTAPYLHDGSAATLRDVLMRSRDGSMGNTGSLADVELDDLEIFLKSL